MDLGISYHECIHCGSLIYPHASISNKGKKIYKVQSNKSESYKKVKELKKIAKNVNETKLDDGNILIEAERYESIIEGNDGEGVEKCPMCGFILVSWHH